MITLRAFSLVATLVTSTIAVVSAHPGGHHHHSGSGGARATHGNFGPDIAHQSYEHGVSADSGVVNLLTTGNGFMEDVDPVQTALRYAAQKLGLSEGSFVISSTHQSKHNGITHVYLQQMVNGFEVANGVANINVDRLGRVISFGNTFHPVKDNQQGGKGKDPLVMPGDADDDMSKFYGLRKRQHFDLADTAMKLGPSDAVASLARFLKIETDENSFSAAPVAGFAPGSNAAPAFVVSGASFAESDIPAKLKYIQESGDLKLVWDLEVEMKDNYYNAYVDTVEGKVISLIDWVSDASYNIYPLGTNDPVSGDRVMVEDPAHPVASPAGWHSHGKVNFTSTIGNNAYAHENFEGKGRWRDNHRPDGGKSLTFDFPVDLKDEPSTYVDAAVTNLFFWNNIIHDLFYVYGFDEEAGNFQENNFGRGGKGGDAVIANAQDGSGYNNANFLTPRDGSQPRMRMYVWDSVSPMRDGDLEGGIVMHEYAHGISIRLTGGPMNVGCLGWGESAGMGEGWGDFFATITRTTPNSTRDDVYGMGEYANGGEGIRKYKYSTSIDVNPSTYGYIKRPNYWGPHAKGEVWAEILYEVYWNLVDAHGFDPDWFHPFESATSSTYRDFQTGTLRRRSHRDAGSASKPKPKHPKTPKAPKKSKGSGNHIALQLVIDGMKLQPCYPTFVDARDAILQADEANNGGENLCLIWEAFAKRGLGADAASGGKEGFEVPKACKKEKE